VLAGRPAGAPIAASHRAVHQEPGCHQSNADNLDDATHVSSLIAVTESLATAIPYVRITDSVGSREVDRVIPAQPTKLRQLASAPSERVINFDRSISANNESSAATARPLTCSSTRPPPPLADQVRDGPLGLDGLGCSPLRLPGGCHDPLGDEPVEDPLGANRYDTGDGTPRSGCGHGPPEADDGRPSRLRVPWRDLQNL
jgi:hypothetical protein